VQQAPVAPPERDLTPDELIARARAIRPRLIERQSETERLRRFPESTHEEILQAGLYRILVPRRYGGYECDLPTFSRVVTELSAGCGSSGWLYCLPSGHALQVASWFGEKAQAELFGDGDFRCPAVAAPVGTATRTADGWELNGTHAYCSGAPYGTHYMGQTLADGAVMLFVAPRSEWTMIEGSWGDLLGLKGSGSHSIRFDGGRIPAHFALENTTMISVDVSGGSPGYALHGNPMYASRALAFFSIEMGAIVLGMAQGALEEYERLIRTRRTQRPPIIPRAEHPDYQTWFGTATGRIAAAEALQLKVCEQWMEVCRRNVEEGPPFAAKDDLLMNMQAREVLRIVWDTMQEILMKTAGSSAMREGERLERIYRDLSMAWGHFHNILGTWTAREYTREHLGLQDPMGL
jgi:3-hydroxy-9,10-secoandrosta-1,3,5(10)-triene-9,17-dione monooxygenase